ncbi:MAG: hypothetical protein EBX52_04645 [Proteobacteria bacterium]|nr:hypothetical protein [Pseudomonadota bacterium]
MPFRPSILVFASLLCSGTARAQFDESSFRQTLKVKKNVYLSNGSFSGGDRLSSNVTIENVRVAANPGGFDRIVIDFAKIERPPFFMVQNDGNSHRIIVTVYGKVKPDFSTQASMQAARKTKSIKKLEFLPVVEPDRWMFTADIQASVKAEVFELTGPARIIIDLKP